MLIVLKVVLQKCVHLTATSEGKVRRIGGFQCAIRIFRALHAGGTRRMVGRLRRRGTVRSGKSGRIEIVPDETKNIANGDDATKPKAHRCLGNHPNRYEERCMTRQSSKVWSEYELKKLKDYADAGASHYRTAAALNRTVSGVRSMAQRHGIRFISPKAARHAAREATPALLS